MVEAESVRQAHDRRASTGCYPRLTLALGQRFACKVGYIVRFADAEGPRLTVRGDWLTP